jgi:uncharacterized protein (DUF2126 family)/transglutaminase-like putative cysteine protease
MSLTIAIHHLTVYEYDRPVSLSPHLVRLRPAPHTRTPLHQYSVKVEPGKHFVNWQQDAFGNYVARYVFPEKAQKLSVEVNLVAELVTINPFDFFIEDYANDFPFRYEPQLAKELAPYFEIKEDGPLLRQWLQGIPKRPDHTVNFIVALNSRLQRDVGYTLRLEPGIQTCEETLALGTGSCRDSAWLLVQILRHLGLAARFVSGYLVQLAVDRPCLDGPSGPEQDFTDLHAWTEVYLPGAGWVGIDPTSGLFAGEGHIPLSCTPDPMSAAPIAGAVDPCEVAFRFENKVTRIREDPRVTKPYSEEQWSAIQTLGEQVDRQLKLGDVRLTQGGEPTFVSIDDMDSPEWNTEALGEHKRERAEDLLRRLYRRWAQGGVMHHGQGKWYPGEQLPRWSLGVFWRADGVPVWRNPALLASYRDRIQSQTNLSGRFISRLAGFLGVPGDHAIPGFEDGVYYLWKEGNLPANVDVLDSKLRDPVERARLRKVFEQGLDRVVGHALPIAWDHNRNAWRSSRWKFRREHLFLLPGDSPMGYRLPLDSLLWEPADQRQQLIPLDPFAPKPPLPADHSELQTRYTHRLGAIAPHPGIIEQGFADADPSDWDRFLIRTALCVEMRDKRLHVFLPPLTGLEHWLRLITAVENTAADLNIPVLLEGYEPPRDERLKRFNITPDPGVIEVNVPPEADWGALSALTESLYEEARLARLATEKFMLDGRHTGTGGGNHVTLGGHTAADSPFLRRPHVLSSLLRFWQHHPGLSYLFSGLFVGPTSQAPRVDEARDESLYELSIALKQLAQHREPSPWLVDRVLRNLLTDMTGNTHRAEFCIDKLYSPDGPTGRLGLVEFRAFEMPPHPQMSMVQMLLLRLLVARFWEHPYTLEPVRWGTELHDRFLLPHFVAADLKDVTDTMRRWGYAFAMDWLAPFLEFRFPHYGSVQIGDAELALRFAIEPWHVLGEEVTAQGTSRFVDSSVERLEIKARGLTEGRHVVACNGRKVPLRRTARRDEWVAGVRYKAWQPASGLHPTIPAQAPLVFDLIDTWNRVSLGGCTYHVAHPAGRNYETFPVNANEAEARRLARFWAHGHTPGPVAAPREEANSEFPYTLDLRT